jgi:putative methanogenesis marker protein 8
MGTKDRHVMEAMGLTRVVIEDGKVVEVGEPMLSYCPLFFKYRGIEEITPEIVRNNIQFRIDDFGMCTSKRKLRMRDFLSFGISEVLAQCLEEGSLDCGVIVSDGAGTVVISDPEIIQGIGGRISGLIETSPISEVIDAIGSERVLDPSSARIDQIDGVKLAKKLGNKRIGVTVAKADDARKIREMCGGDAVIFGVHLTGLSHEEAMDLFETCDVITACASKSIREIGESRSLYTVGKKIPIYAPTEVGASIMKRRLERIGKSRNKENVETPDPPRPLL